MSAPRLTPTLEDYPLSAFRDSVFNIFATTFHIRRQFLHPLPEDAPCAGYRDPQIMGCLALVTGTHRSWGVLCRNNYINFISNMINIKPPHTPNSG